MSTAQDIRLTQFIVRPTSPGAPVSILLVVGAESIELSWSALDAIDAARALLAAVRDSIGPFDAPKSDEELARPECRVQLAHELLCQALSDLIQTTKGQTHA